MRDFTFGSLFDGIGAFSLGLVRVGCRLAWSVEIEPECRRVTAARFPGVPQHEDVRHVGRHNLQAVDLVVGGSPCQDWSVAGKRSGLAGERAPLFSELVRVAREVSARWLLWENVPGVLSQHSGEDFAFVLGEFTGARPEVPKGGWRNSGFGWGPAGSVCWRVLDARHFGVPQRRRRVFALVRPGDACGLAGEEPGQDAGRLRRLPVEVLFEPACLFGDLEAGREEGQGVAPSVTPGARRASGNRSGELLAVTPQAFRELAEGHATYQPADVATSLRGAGGGGGMVANLVSDPLLGHHPRDTTDGGLVVEAGQCHGSNVGPLGTLRAGNGNEHGGVPFIVNAAESCAVKDHAREAEVSRCLDSGGPFTANQGGTVVGFHTTQDPISGDVAPALSGSNACGTGGVAYGIGSDAVDRSGEGAAGTAAARSGLNIVEECQPTLRARPNNSVAAAMTVRRLTPVECLRLQGLPDDWLDVDPPLSDSRTYHMIGNAGAVPVLEWLGRRILAALTRDSP